MVRAKNQGNRNINHRESQWPPSAIGNNPVLDRWDILFWNNATSDFIIKLKPATSWKRFYIKKYITKLTMPTTLFFVSALHSIGCFANSFFVRDLRPFRNQRQSILIFGPLQSNL